MRGATYAQTASSIRFRISIHAPHAGCDVLQTRGLEKLKEFQSTHPVWGATSTAAYLNPIVKLISIHAPRVGCDQSGTATSHWQHDFNPRTPCGGCDLQRKKTLPTTQISIHAPRVGCDQSEPSSVSTFAISIHAPARGATPPLSLSYAAMPYFNPRTREGCDAFTIFFFRRLERFQSTHPRGVRHICR